MSPAAPIGRPWILPNLGAEEGEDWRAYPREAHARIATRLLGLLFAPTARAAHPDPSGGWQSEPVHAHWPSALGPPPNAAVEPWLDTTPEAFAWLNTRSLAESVARGLPGQPHVRLAGPEPDCIEALHDKRFALDCARALGLHSSGLDPWIEVLEPADCVRVDETLARLAASLARWPEWTGLRFTLKPRLGSSGRGRTGGVRTVDRPDVRGALARLARRGGALFEPWLDRTRDLSVVLHQPRGAPKPGILASFELLTTKSGVFRGHCGEIDPGGRVASGDPEDERLCQGAVGVVERAAARGFFGICGVDAFRYREGDREGWRGVVELNARPTMGLVSYGLLRRALPRPDGALAPGRSRGFLFTFLDADAEDAQHAILARAGPDARALELVPIRNAGEPRALLYLAPDRSVLREAYRSVIGC